MATSASVVQWYLTVAAADAIKLLVLLLGITCMRNYNKYVSLPYCWSVCHITCCPLVSHWVCQWDRQTINRRMPYRYITIYTMDVASIVIIAVILYVYLSVWLLHSWIVSLSMFYEHSIACHFCFLAAIN